MRKVLNPKSTESPLYKIKGERMASVVIAYLSDSEYLTAVDNYRDRPTSLILALVNDPRFDRRREKEVFIHVLVHRFRLSADIVETFQRTVDKYVKKAKLAGLVTTRILQYKIEVKRMPPEYRALIGWLLEPLGHDFDISYLSDEDFTRNEVLELAQTVLKFIKVNNLRNSDWIKIAEKRIVAEI